MERNKVREMLLNQSTAAGNAEKESSEIGRIQAASEPTDMATFTVGCSPVLTLVCC